MKAKVLLSLTIVGLLLFEPAVLARGSSCRAIKAACEAAGFISGGHKSGKGLARDCVEPILAGQVVAGVSVNPAEVQACQAQRANSTAGSSGNSGTGAAAPPAQPL